MKYYKIRITISEADDSIVSGTVGDPTDSMVKPTLWFRLDNPHGSAGVGIICTDKPEHLEEAIKVYIGDVYKHLVEQIKNHKEV